jgi:4-diphosphocytidyl-2C-methyl-D-erythritol kinase
LAEGTGDRLRPLPAVRFACVLALGRPGVNTAWAYSQITVSHFTDGGRAARGAALVQAGRVPDPWNAFAEALRPARPDLGALIARMAALTQAPAGLTGSGSCVFGLPPDEETARAAANALAADGLWTWCGASAAEPLTLEEDT